MSKKTGDFTGNRGEWSEVYVLFKLLVDKKLQGADQHGNPNPQVMMDVLKVFRGKLEASVNKNIEIVNAGHKFSFQVTDINTNVVKLYKAIAKEEGIIKAKSGAFSVPQIEAFLRGLGCTQLTSAGTKKRDITVQIDDCQHGAKPIQGFSIKSEIGGAPSLLNATKATNLIFELDGLSDKDIKDINSIVTKEKIIDRCNLIKRLAKNINFDKFNNLTFSENLRGIDGDLPAIISYFVYAHYFEACSTCEEAVQWLEKQNPLNFKSTIHYSIKIKRFLRSVALGMKPASAWYDEDDATGGYIIAKPNGALVAFFIYDRRLFDNYLMKLTKFERGSITKHDFMVVYKQGNKFFVKLNLQIRFT